MNSMISTNELAALVSQGYWVEVELDGDIYQAREAVTTKADGSMVVALTHATTPALDHELEVGDIEAGDSGIDEPIWEMIGKVDAQS